MPVFASEPFLKAVGDEYGWLGGTDDQGQLRCILPYTIIRKGIVRMLRFRVETIPAGAAFEISEERAFLNSAMEYFRTLGVDIIVPGTTNAIFRTFPDRADAAPYGTYVIDLSKPEEELWKGIHRIVRQNIRTAQKDGVAVADGTHRLAEIYSLTRDTFKRSHLPFMGHAAYERFVNGLGDRAKILIAEYKGVIQSGVVFAFSDYCGYAVYAGNLVGQHQGANKLIYWEAIRWFKQMGVRRFDFVGARINPEKGSKQESINAMKQRFGATLIQGYIWKYPLHPLKSLAYSLGVRFLRGGDIVDAERHKLKAVCPGTGQRVTPAEMVPSANAGA